MVYHEPFQVEPTLRRPSPASRWGQRSRGVLLNSGAVIVVSAVPHFW